MLNQKYKSASTAIASYDYADISEGTGIKTLYFARATGGDILTENPYYSQTIGTSAQDPSETITFNLSAFNTPKIISGTCRINIPFLAVTTAGYTSSVDITIKKNTTTLASVGTGNYNASHNSFALLAVAIPKTIFKKGDYLSVVAVLTGSGTGTRACGIGHDPKDREFVVGGQTMVHTQMNIGIPFVLDL